MKKITPSTRRKLYRIAQAAIGLAVVYGLVAADYATLWLVLVAAVLDLAVRNVPVED